MILNLLRVCAHTHTHIHTPWWLVTMFHSSCGKEAWGLKKIFYNILFYNKQYTLHKNIFFCFLENSITIFLSFFSILPSQYSLCSFTMLLVTILTSRWQLCIFGDSGHATLPLIKYTSWTKIK